MTWTVYAIRENSEVVYIGSTSRQLKTRLMEHKYAKRVSWDATIEKLCFANTRKLAENKEEHIINLIGLHRLINKIAQQQSGLKGRLHSEDTKERIRKSHIGKKHDWDQSWTQERRINSIKALTGVKKRPGTANERLVRMGYREFDLYKDGQLIGRFVNQTHAARSLNMAKSTFVNIFKGIRIDKKGIEVKYVP